MPPPLIYIFLLAIANTSAIAGCPGALLTPPIPLKKGVVQGRVEALDAFTDLTSAFIGPVVLDWRRSGQGIIVGDGSTACSTTEVQWADNVWWTSSSRFQWKKMSVELSDAVNVAGLTWKPKSLKCMPAFPTYTGGNVSDVVTLSLFTVGYTVGVVILSGRSTLSIGSGGRRRSVLGGYV